MEIHKLIFGKTYTFIVKEAYYQNFRPSIELYPDSKNKKSDVIIYLNNSENFEGSILSKNPAAFLKSKDYIQTAFYKGKTFWKWDTEHEVLTINLEINPRKSGIKGLYRQFRSMEFSTEAEEFQQILHEIVLVSSVYFLKDLSLIHSAAFSIDNKATLLAGTGGTGKTSALLSLRKDKRVSFVADDICVVSKNGTINPNLAWPKIYGYNLSSYISKEELLKDRGAIDRFQFNYKVKKNPHRVRRKLKPNELYQNFCNSPVPIENIYYLFRDDSKGMKISILDKEKAIEMGIHVMKTEYGKILHNYLEWDKYNSLALGEEPILDLEQVFDIWRNNLRKAFENINIKLLHIPYHIPHEEYLINIHKIILP